MSLDTLTSNDRDILVRVAQGYGSKVIAHDLNTTKWAIDWARKQMKRKTGMTIYELIVLAVKAGWV